ncbi:MAG: tRNA lysidine(34) synthetase TilS [Flavobacteriaceae bacterium]
MKSRFKAHLESNFPMLHSKRLLVAVSGGVDSMVLLDLLRDLSYIIGVAHCNFQLRGEESDLDQQLVKEYCNTHDIPFYQKNFDTDLPKQSTQMAARTLRYEWFETLIQTEHYDWVLTAHHADDNIETLLMNITRGTGIEGLAAIPEQNGKILRPLLPYYKSEIVDYAKTHGIEWREDRSNQTDDYTRNIIRHHLIPQLTKLHPKALENTSKTIELTKEAVSVVHQETETFLNELFQIREDVTKIPIKSLKNLEPLSFWIHQLFSIYGFDQGEVIKLLDAQKGKFIFSQYYTLEVGRGDLLLYKTVNRNMNDEFEVFEDGLNEPVKITFSTEQINGENHLSLDASTISFPLKLRKWKKGDRFFPIGMTGAKKVAKFFKDEKYTANEKAAQWLLCSGNDIVWIVGKRLDRRFVPSKTTENIIHINLQ